MRLSSKRRHFLLTFAALVATTVSAFSADNWEATVSPFAPGSFPELRPLRAKYNFGWNGVTAASGDIRLARGTGGRFELEAKGGTLGFARSLWPYDVKHVGVSDANTLRPIEVAEVETFGKKEVTTKATFTNERADSVQEERRGSAVASKNRGFTSPNIFSVDSALLYLRTQPLKEGAVQRVVIYPATSAYLATITVVGHEQLTVPTGTYDAIKLDVQLSKIGKNRQLQKHKKFKRATVWLSNDADRLILRVETQVFIGTVYAELQSLQFENANAKP
ncbi:MAG: DUF3108 domain-containing protein [Chthoniobacterales bacterium]